jgi:hypothetical protein
VKALVLCGILTAGVFGCGFQTKGMHTAMTEEVPPRFSFSGGRFDHVSHLPFFIVVEVPAENQSVRWNQPQPKENRAIWWIFPETGADGELKNLPVITYGTLPPRFVQKVPEQGEPPKLEEGKVYEAGGPAVMVPCTYIRFTIRNGKAVRVPIPGKDDGDECKSC